MSRPGIATAPFVPRPDAQLAQWSVTVRRFDGTYVTLEVIEPTDVEALGQPIHWVPSGEGYGVLYARIAGPKGGVYAIARAVPLS